MRTVKKNCRRWLCALLAGLMTMTSVPAAPAFAQDTKEQEQKQEVTKDWSLDVYHVDAEDVEEAETIYRQFDDAAGEDGITDEAREERNALVLSIIEEIDEAHNKEKEAGTFKDRSFAWEKGEDVQYCVAALTYKENLSKISIPVTELFSYTGLYAPGVDYKVLYRPLDWEYGADLIKGVTLKRTIEDKGNKEDDEDEDDEKTAKMYVLIRFMKPSWKDTEEELEEKEETNTENFFRKNELEKEEAEKTAKKRTVAAETGALGLVKAVDVTLETEDSAPIYVTADKMSDADTAQVAASLESESSMHMTPVLAAEMQVLDEDGDKFTSDAPMTVRMTCEDITDMKNALLYVKSADNECTETVFTVNENDRYVEFSSIQPESFIFVKAEGATKPEEELDESLLDGKEVKETVPFEDEKKSEAVFEDKEPSAEEKAQEELEKAEEAISKRLAEEKLLQDTYPEGLVEVEADENNKYLSNKELSKTTKKLVGLSWKGLKLAASSQPPHQEPVTEDGMTIEKITARWLSRSAGESSAAGFDRLVLRPTTEDVTNQQWQIDFALSGKHEHATGSIEIVLPAYIWKNRDGEEPGRLTLAVPEEPETGGDFSWKRVGDSIVLTNTHSIPAATKVMIQGTFRDVLAHEMVDKAVSEESEYASAEYKGVSDKFSATITVETPNGSEVSMTSNEIDAEIDTYVEAAAATKTAYNPTTKEYSTYWKIPEGIPEELLPENPENYVYVRWFVSGQAEGNQPFTMTVSDTRTDEYDSIVLGIQDVAGTGTNVKCEDGETVSAVLYDGYNTTPKTAYVWTAYPKSSFTEEFVVYTLHNTQTISVTGWDDKITTTKTASAECSVSIPIEYTVRKIWDDDDNELGLRPETQTVRITRNTYGGSQQLFWKSVALKENPTPEEVAEGYGPWSYTWSDEGKGWHYDTDEPWLANGTFETWYDESGKKHTNGWHYRQKSKNYDPDARTWTFINDIVTDGLVANFADMDKRVWAQYDHPDLKSSSDNALNRLMHGEDAIVPYDVWGTAETVDVWIDNATSGDINTHRTDIVLEDYLNMANNQRITLDDADLAYVDIVQPSLYGYAAAVKDDTLPADDPNRYYDPPRYTLAKYVDDYTDARFEALVDGEWIEVGELHGTTLTTKNGASQTGMRIILPAHTQQFREIVNTYAAATYLKYTVGVRVHPSEWVLGQINNAAQLSDYLMMTLDNYARLYKVDNGVRSTWELSQWDRGYLHGRIYKVASWLQKDFRVTGNDTANKRITIHTRAEATQQSNILFSNEYEYGVTSGDIPFTRAGTWFDLMPIGIKPDISTIKLEGGDRLLDAYTVEDYQGTGRTLLVIKASYARHQYYKSSNSSGPFKDDSTYPNEGYGQTMAVEFDSYYAWEDARMFGLETTRNTIAFETDDDEIGTIAGWSGETDDPTSGGNKWSENEVGTDADLMKNLDVRRNDPSFIYAGANLITDEIDFAAETSIRKWVSSEGSGVWSYGHNNEAVVYEGGKYTYRINLNADTDTSAKNIIIMDALENYVPTSDKDDYGDAQWRGRFLGLNVYPLEQAGVAPVVYYSTLQGIDISKETGQYNVSDEQGVIADILANAETEGKKVWSTTPPEDLSTVTAIAVDCRKDKNGNDFILESGAPLEMFIYMRAPGGQEASAIWGSGKGTPENAEEVDEKNPDHNAHAYNNVYLDSTQIDGVGRETHAYIHWDYDKVGIIPFNLEVNKSWSDMDNNDGLRSEDVTVHLYADGTDTGKSLTLSEATEWHGVFSHILRYDYDTGEDGYTGQDDGHYIDYSFVEDPIEGYEMSYDRTGDTVQITNTHIPEKISINVEKTWKDDEANLNARPSSIALRLMADGKFTGTRRVVRPDYLGNWKCEFANLYKYKNGAEITYTVEEEPLDDYVATMDGYNITNTYHPWGDLTVRKTVVNGTAAALAKEFTFTLLLKDAEENDLVDKYDYKVYDSTDAVVREGKVGTGSEFTLKHGERICIEGIPTHTQYQVIETQEKGFTAESENAEGEIIASGAEASFTNTYASAGKAEVSAFKVLSGRDLTRYQFQFDLRQVIEGNDPVLMRTASNKADGSVSFGGLSFTDADDGKTFTYEIVEKDKSKPGYTYDGSVVKVEITPHDQGDGTLSFDVVYKNQTNEPLSASDVYVFGDRTEMPASDYDALTAEEKDALILSHQKNGFDAEKDEVVPPVLQHRSPAVFRNEYHATGEITLRAWKELLGRPLQDNEFEFKLCDAEGNQISTAHNTADGSIVFDPLQFTEADVGKTLYYYVKEIAGNDDTVNYDSSVFGYQVTILDNGDGTLSFSQGHASPIYKEGNEVDTSAIRYAVSVYDIAKDIDENGNVMGLTFGPALGKNYVNSFKSHEPTGETTSGNPHRCLHNDAWATIIQWNNKDPYVYEQCIGQGCTHSVELDFSETETLVNPEFVPQYTGDGPSVLLYELMPTDSNYENLRWNPKTEGGDLSYGTNKLGWGATRIRAMLNGRDELDVLGRGYASRARSDPNKDYSIYTDTNCLLNTFPEELQTAIGRKAVRYDSVYNNKTEANLKTSYDKLWLLSPNEIATSISRSWAQHPLEASSPYARFSGNNEVSGWASSGTFNPVVGYGVQAKDGKGTTICDWWLRSSNSNYSNSPLYVERHGYISSGNAHNSNHVAPCFTLSANAEVPEPKIVGWDTESGEIPVFTNTLKPGDLAVTKRTVVHEGDEPDPNQMFHFKVQIVTPDGSELNLPAQLDEAPHKPIIYVTYKGMGGTFFDTEDQDENILEYHWNGSSYDLFDGEIAEPKRYGYSFAGWFCDAEYSMPYDTATTPQDDSVVYAKWERIPHTVKLNLNGGTYDGLSGLQTIKVWHGDMLGDVVDNSLLQNGAQKFQYWYKNEELTDWYDPEEPLESDVTLWAAWSTPGVKYAVSVYDIEKDIDENGDVMGLTFGPALGENYLNSVKAHEPTGETESGNPHRCVHNDDWNTIIKWNHKDPYVYEQCIGQGCTHSVELDFSETETLANPDFVPQYTGDGPSVLYSELMPNSSNNENLRWNPKTEGGSSSSGTNKLGWGATRVRAMLNGRDELDVLGSGYGSYASSDPNKDYSIYTDTNCLLNTFPQELQAAIGRKAVKYDSVYNSKTEANLKTSYDKLWLLSPNEIWTTSQNTNEYFVHPLEGEQYQFFARCAERGKAVYDAAEGFRVNYQYHTWGEQYGSGMPWWSRSTSCNPGYCWVTAVSRAGTAEYTNADDGNRGISPCFTLSR